MTAKKTATVKKSKTSKAVKAKPRLNVYDGEAKTAKQQADDASAKKLARLEALDAPAAEGESTEKTESGSPNDPGEDAAPAPTSVPAKKPKVAKPERMSALDAAAKVLQEAGEPMNAKVLIEAMATKEYWTSPGGKTPHATLYSAIQREISVKGKESRFEKTSKGHFAATRGA